MSVSLMLTICAFLYLLVVLIDSFRSHSFKRVALELILLVGLIVFDVMLASRDAGYVTFGPDNSPGYVTLAIMFAAIVCGIVARYVFSLKGAFSWPDLLKPLFISPLLLLQMMGSLQSVRQLEPLQLASFALLAFQNGFFWQSLLQKSRLK